MRRGLLALVSAAVAAMLLGATEAQALSCVGIPDEEAAAREAINGEHPLWASGYVVAVVENIRSSERELSIVVRPTHVFSGEYPEQLRLLARSDGPPDPSMFQLGRAYFLSLDQVEGSDGLLIQPCAPNFAITAEQLERLIDSAPHVEVREPGVPAANSGPPIWAITTGVTVLVLAAGVALIAWQRGPALSTRAR